MLGDYMKAHRHAARRDDGSAWSVAALAEAVGVTRATLHNWEAGHRWPTVDNLGTWASVLGLTDTERLAAFDMLAAREDAA